MRVPRSSCRDLLTSRVCGRLCRRVWRYASIAGLCCLSLLKRNGTLAETAQVIMQQLDFRFGALHHLHQHTFMFDTGPDLENHFRILLDRVADDDLPESRLRSPDRFVVDTVELVRPLVDDFKLFILLWPVWIVGLFEPGDLLNYSLPVSSYLKALHLQIDSIGLNCSPMHADHCRGLSTRILHYNPVNLGSTLRLIPCKTFNTEV
jgi:hypothetical protein